MSRPWGHSPSYHAWPSSTPVIDAVGSVVAVASVVIGAHALLFLAYALGNGDAATATQDASFLVAIAIANCAVDALRRWRRHHA
jgi:hypothetical protein